MRIRSARLLGNWLKRRSLVLGLRSLVFESLGLNQAATNAEPKTKDQRPKTKDLLGHNHRPGTAVSEDLRQQRVSICAADYVSAVYATLQ
jgi:hypothetical protein